MKKINDKLMTSNKIKGKKTPFMKDVSLFVETAVDNFNDEIKKPIKEREVPIGVSLNIFLGTLDLTQRQLVKLITLDELEFMHEQFMGAYERMMYNSSNPNLKYLHSTLMNGGEWEALQRLIMDKEKHENEKPAELKTEFIYED